jgi:hypothetical protein
MLYIPAIWFGTTVLTILLLILLLFFNSGVSTNKSRKYSLYSARPLVLGAMTGEAGLGDPRAAKIDQVFSSYNCPLEGLGNVFVSEADKNDIPYWVVAAISFQESSCGKRIPMVDSLPSYNAWGWAVYGDNVKVFDSWEHGIAVVSEYMSERFFSQGVTDLCEIMRTYTPPSQGSWCEGVDYFKDIINEYKTPLL